MFDETIQQRIKESIQTKELVLSSPTLLNLTRQVAQLCIQALKADHKIFFCGNGGSAADAQHLATELSGRYYYDRPPLFAEALNVNMSFVTAVGNDYGYDAVFARSIQAKGRPGDILFALSTSGNSPNVIEAVKMAQKSQVVTIGMTGLTGGKLKEHCDHLLAIPSTDTPRIQECHMLLGHIICELIEVNMFPR